MIFYRQIKPFSAITFDLDDTLYNNDVIMHRAENGLLEYIQQRFTKAKNTDLQFWRAAKRMVIKDNPRLLSDMALLRKAQLTCGFSQCGYGEKELENIVTDSFEYVYFLRSDFKVNKNICSLLGTLADKMPLVAITNGNVKLDQIGIDKYFSSSFHASMQRPMKPHRHMFEEALTFLSLPAHSVLHVGDNLEKDIWGAKSVGMQTAWIAANRAMDLNKEATSVLPDVQLSQLEDLLQLV